MNNTASSYGWPHSSVFVDTPTRVSAVGHVNLPIQLSPTKPVHLNPQKVLQKVSVMWSFIYN